MVGVVTVMRVLLFVLAVSMLRECDERRRECGTRGSYIMFSAADMLRMRRVSGVCEMCISGW